MSGSLRPMREDEYGAFVERSKRVYAGDMVRAGISQAGWDPRWFQSFLGLLLLVALLANGVVRRRLRAVPPTRGAGSRRSSTTTPPTCHRASKRRWRVWTPRSCAVRRGAARLF